MNVEQFRQIVERAQDVIIVTEAEPLHEPGPRIVFVNAAFTRLTGYTAEEAIGRSPRLLQRPQAVDPETQRAIRAGLASGEGFQGPVLNFGKDGTSYWLDMHIFALHDDRGLVTHFAAIERDITARVLREIELQSAANTDALTGLFNRRALEYMVAGAWNSNATNCVQLLDLDQFKGINDTYGHAVGDKVLEALADVLLKDARDGDYPVRLGGDEFAMVLMGTTMQEALRLARRLQDELEYALATRDLPKCTLSIGIADSAGALQETIDVADEALRRAKQQGRNRVLVAG